MNKKLYVGNLLYEATEDQLRDLFSQAGEVVSAQVIRFADSGRSKGFAFIEIVVLAAGVMVILIEAMIVTAVMIVVKIDRLLKLLKLLTWVHKTSICQHRYLLKRLQKSGKRKSNLKLNKKMGGVPPGPPLFFMQFNPYLREDS